MNAEALNVFMTTQKKLAGSHLIIIVITYTHFAPVLRKLQTSQLYY